MRTSLKLFAVAYGLIAAFFCGWLTPQFEFYRSLILACFFGAPCLVAWTISTSNTTISLRTCVSLACATLLVACCSVFLTMNLYETDLDKKIAFDRVCAVFRRQVKSLSGYEQVDITYSHMKGGAVRLTGTVSNKELHDQLIWMTRGLLLSQEMTAGYRDNVTYPAESQPERDN